MVHYVNVLIHDDENDFHDDDDCYDDMNVDKVIDV